MAGKNEIKHRLSLEGDDEVKAKLKSVGEAGKQSLGDIEKKLGEAHGGLGKLGEPLGELKEALAPFLEGAELGGLGGLLEGGLISRLLGAAGPAAAIAALGGVALHLAKVSEESEKTDKRLKALGGGAKAFDELEKSAKKLGTSPESLQGGYEDFLSSRNEAQAKDHSVTYAPGYQPDYEHQPQVISGGKVVSGPLASNETFLSAQRTLQYGARLDESDPKRRDAAIDQFTKSVNHQGLTADVLKALKAALPDDAKRVAAAVGPEVGQAFPNTDIALDYLTRRGPISGDKVYRGLQKAEPQAEKDAAEARGVSDALEKLKSSALQLDKAFSNLAGGPLNKFLKDKVDNVAGGVEKAAELVEHNKDKIVEGAKHGYELGSKTGIVGAGVLGGAIGGGLAVERGVGGDLIKEYGPELKEQIAKQFEQFGSGVPEFLKNAVINPGALGPNETGGASKLTPEALGDTTIPKPLTDSASRKALLIGSPLLGAARFLPELFGLTKGEPPQDAPPPQAQQPITPPSLPPQQGDTNPTYNWPVAPARVEPQPQPAPEPTLDQLLQQRAAAGPPPQLPSIVNDIAGLLQGLVEKFAKPESTKLEGPAASNGLGVRGDAGPLDNGGAPQNVAALNGVAGDAAEGLRQVASAAPAAASNLSSGGKEAPTTTVAASGGGLIGHFADGGSVSAPRVSATSRVAKAVKRMFARGGPVGFADGGDTQDTDAGDKKANSPPRLGPGDHQITFDPATGGAFIDGILHLPGDPLLDDPTVKQGMAQSKAGMNDKGSKHERYHSPFVGRFGHDDSNGAEDTYVARGGFLAGMHDVRRYDGGGAVRGPGTTTSDDIDAKLSHGEFVVNARDTARSLPFLKSLNQGDSIKKAISKLARGGQVRRFADGGVNSDEVDDPNAGPWNDPHLTDDQSIQMLNDAVSGKKKRKGSSSSSGGMQFVDQNAQRRMLQMMDMGMPIGGPLQQSQRGVGQRGFADGGYVDLPGFMDGGSVGSASALSEPSPTIDNLSSGSSAGHHSIDLKTDFGNFRVMAPEDIARSMSAAARDSANAQTGQRPSWYRGR